jgi:hypothetical protein
MRYAHRLTDIISIAICQTDAHILVKEMLKIQSEVGVDEIASVLELVVDAVVA